VRFVTDGHVIGYLLCIYSNRWTIMGLRAILAIGLAAACSLWAESAGKDVGSGAGDIAKGPVKGAGSVAKGTGKGALDVVTLHPVKGAESVGKGAAGAGKDVAVGTVKGTGKVVKGVGKAIGHVL
jgi:hypothetical protein